MELTAGGTPARVAAAGMGFYSDEESLGLVAPFADRHRAPIILRATTAQQVSRSLRRRGHTSALIADCAAWRGRFATAQQSVAIDNAGTLFGTDLNKWGSEFLTASGASAVLTPSLFVRGGDWPAMRSLVSDLGTVAQPGVVPFIATSGSMLTAPLLGTLRRRLAPIAGRPIGFLFAGGRDLFAHDDTIRGLRALLTDVPNAWVVGVDVLIGTDALAQGAEWAFVGVRSGMRWPAVPGEANKGFAHGYMPGLFNRDLLAMRTPTVYADWYVNSASPACSTCSRPADAYSASDSDKSAILEHNLHAFRSLAEELAVRQPSARASWLHTERVAAFEAHYGLSATGRTLAADLTLRRLCEIDDPLARATTPAGSWR